MIWGKRGHTLKIFPPFISVCGPYLIEWLCALHVILGTRTKCSCCLHRWSVWSLPCWTCGGIINHQWFTVIILCNDSCNSITIKKLWLYLIAMPKFVAPTSLHIFVDCSSIGHQLSAFQHGTVGIHGSMPSTQISALHDTVKFDDCSNWQFQHSGLGYYNFWCLCLIEKANMIGSELILFKSASSRMVCQTCSTDLMSLWLSGEAALSDSLIVLWCDWLAFGFQDPESLVGYPSRCMMHPSIVYMPYKMLCFLYR